MKPLRYWLVVAGLVALLVQGAWRERIPVGDGAGWDGARYQAMAQDFPQLLTAGKIDRYKLQRALPCAVVYYGLRMVGAARTAEQVQRGFVLLNAACLFITAVALWGITRQFRRDQRPLSEAVVWIGLFALVGNYAVLKIGAYYPVLTDLPALACGAVTAWCYFARQRLAVLLVSALGAFVWPTSWFLGVGLAAFPWKGPGSGGSPSDGSPSVGERSARGCPGWRWGGQLALLVGYPLLAAWLYARGDLYSLNGSNQPTRLWVLPSLLGTYVYLSVIVWRFLPCPRPWFASWRKRTFMWLAVAVAVSLGLRYAFHALSSAEGVLSGGRFLQNLIRQSLVYPFGNLVAHGIYFGPWVPLAVHYHRELAAAARRQGPACQATVAAFLVLAVGTESRQFINFIPLLVVLLMCAIEEHWRAWPKWLIPVHLAGSLLAARFYWPLGVTADELAGDFLHFPAQRYFLSLGPWMGVPAFVVGASVTLAVWLLYARFCPRRVTDVHSQQ